LLITITAILLFSLWGILFFIHVFRLIGLDGFSLNSFKAGHSRIISADYKRDLDAVQVQLEKSEFILRDIKFKKHILISIKRGVFKFTPGDPFYKFRTVIDYTSSDRAKVTIHWDNHWIAQSYIFFILVPSLLLGAFDDIILSLLFICVTALIYYYFMHKVELKRVGRHESRMRKLLDI